MSIWVNDANCRLMTRLKGNTPGNSSVLSIYRTIPTTKWKKALGETQTLHAGRSIRGAKNFRPAADPHSVEHDGQINQLEMVTTFTYKPSLWRSMHAISSYRGNSPTKLFIYLSILNLFMDTWCCEKLTVPQSHKHTNIQTNRQGRLQYTAPLASAQCNQPLFRLHEHCGCLSGKHDLERSPIPDFNWVCDLGCSVGTGFSGHGSTGQRHRSGLVGSWVSVTDPCSVWPGICRFCTRVIVAYGDSIRHHCHVEICEIAVVLN